MKVNDQVVFHGKVVEIRLAGSDYEVLAEDSAGRRCWIKKSSLECDSAPPPVTVRCDKCGAEHPLTDFETLRDRCKALGLGEWGSASLHDFMELYAMLAEKGVTAEQFVEGLP